MTVNVLVKSTPVRQKAQAVGQAQAFEPADIGESEANQQDDRGCVYDAADCKNSGLRKRCSLPIQEQGDQNGAKNKRQHRKRR